MNLSRVLFVGIISLAMYLSTFTEMKSACPPGFSETFVQIWVDGCEYDLQVCFKCQAGSYTGEVNVFGFGLVYPDPPCTSSLTTPEIFEAICQQVYDYQFIKDNICNMTIPPCLPYDEGIWYSFFREICWMKSLLPDGRIWYSTCNLSNTYCTEVYKICYDPTLPFPNIRKTLMHGPDISGQYVENCQGMTEPEEDPTIPGIYSTCFEVHTPCNP